MLSYLKSHQKSQLSNSVWPICDELQKGGKETEV